MCSLFIINIIIGVRAYAPFAVTIKKKLNSIKFFFYKNSKITLGTKEKFSLFYCQNK